MSEFLNLPSELIELIGEASNTQDDLLALSRTCKLFYTFLKPRLIPYNIKNRKSSGLRAAARLNDMDVAREFLRHKGVDVNSTILDQCGTLMTPLLIAVDHGHEDMAILLLENGAHPKKGDRDSEEQLFQLLGEVARVGAADVVQALLARGVPVNPKWSWLFKAQTPLYGAVTGASHEAAILLLQNGADLCYDLCDLVRVFRPCMLSPRVDEDTKRRRREILEFLQFAATSAADDTYLAKVQGVLEWVLQYIEV